MVFIESICVHRVHCIAVITSCVGSLKFRFISESLLFFWISEHNEAYAVAYCSCYLYWLMRRFHFAFSVFIYMCASGLAFVISYFFRMCHLALHWVSVSSSIPNLLCSSPIACCQELYGFLLVHIIIIHWQDNILSSLYYYHIIIYSQFYETSHTAL